jgi:hypothetical protein
MEAETIQWWQALAKRSSEAHAESREHVAVCVEAGMAAEIALGLREHNELLAKQKNLLASLKLRLELVTEKPPRGPDRPGKGEGCATSPSLTCLRSEDERNRSRILFLSHERKAGLTRRFTKRLKGERCCQEKELT